MVAINPQKLMGRTKKIQSKVDDQQQELIATPINIAVSQNILDSLAKITELISQQNLQIVEIIKEVKQPKSVEVKPGPSIQPQQQLIGPPGLPGAPGLSIQPQQQLIESPGASGLSGTPGLPGAHGALGTSLQPQQQIKEGLI